MGAGEMNLCDGGAFGSRIVISHPVHDCPIPFCFLMPSGTPKQKANMCGFS